MCSKILFVCTGNISRSPMAEALLKKYLKARGLEGKVEVSSAGELPPVREHASGKARAVLAERCGEDLLRSHRPRRLTSAMVAEADTILTMTVNNKRWVTEHFPHAAGKIWTLKEYAGYTDELDIYDPLGGSLEIYRRCAEEIDACISKIVDKLLQHQKRSACSEVKFTP